MPPDLPLYVVLGAILLGSAYVLIKQSLVWLIPPCSCPMCQKRRLR